MLVAQPFRSRCEIMSTVIRFRCVIMYYTYKLIAICCSWIADIKVAIFSVEAIATNIFPHVSLS